MTPAVASTATFAQTLARIARQAWPVLISQWAGISYGVLDTAMTGHAGPTALAAMALAASIYITIFVGLMGVVHALIPIIGQHFGASRLDDVGAAWGQGVWLALGLSVVGGLLMAFPDMWLSFSGDIAPEVRHNIRSYLYALILALPAALVFRTIYSLGTAVSRPKLVMLIGLCSVAIKAALNYAFIYGAWGFPELGAAGAGLSTAVVYWLSVAAGMLIIWRDPFYRQFRLRIGRPDWKILKELLRLGIPMGGSYLVEVCAFTFMALLVAREGTFVSGGHQIMSNLAALCYMMPMALGVATASLTAQAVGGQDHALAKRIALGGMVLGIVGALLTSAILLGGQARIIAAYTNNADIAMVAATLLPMIPLFHLFDSMQCINSYVLRAYKIAVVPLIIQVIALSVIGLIGGWWLGFGPGRGQLSGVLAWILPGAPEGAGTMWLMSMLGLALSAILLHVWFWRVVSAATRPHAPVTAR